MNILKYILGYRDFNKLNDFKNYLVSKGLIQETEQDNIKYLILFSTTKQKTWLLANEDYLFCFLDDTSKDTFELRWKEKKSKMINNFEIHTDYKNNTGIINFGENHKRWLYSKELFKTEDDLKKRLNDLLK